METFDSLFNAEAIMDKKIFEWDDLIFKGALHLPWLN